MVGGGLNIITTPLWKNGRSSISLVDELTTCVFLSLSHQNGLIDFSKLLLHFN